MKGFTTHQEEREELSKQKRKIKKLQNAQLEIEKDLIPIEVKRGLVFFIKKDDKRTKEQILIDHENKIKYNR